MKRPEVLREWTTEYYGARGECKSLHIGLDVVMVLRYHDKFYAKFPYLNRRIVVSDQKLNPELEALYLGRDLFYYNENDLESVRWCPRKNCWLGNQRHKLHGCLLVMDDISNYMPANTAEYGRIPKWFKKMLIHGRKRGIHIITSCVDPFDVNIEMRRTTDMCYKFRKTWGSPDPDETEAPLKYIWGFYTRRRIAADLLYKYGDLPEQIIRLTLADRAKLHDSLAEAGKAADIIYDDSWYGSTHMFNRKGKFLWIKCAGTNFFDTHQEIAEED